MALTLYGFHAYPSDFAATKIDASVEDCPFLLDFSRPIRKRHSLMGKINDWIGPTVALHVPVVHRGESNGGFMIAVYRDESYFKDILKLWRMHGGCERIPRATQADGLEIIADFGRHFPQDCS